MDQMSKEEMAQRDKMFQAIILQNGNSFYRKFTNVVRDYWLRIIGISAPIQMMPTCVAFVDPELKNVVAANDSSNLDSNVPKTFAPPPKAKAKKSGLKVVK